MDMALSATPPPPNKFPPSPPSRRTSLLHPPLAPILVEEGRIAGGRRAEAAAAGGHHDKPLARAHELGAFALHLAPALDGDHAAGAVAAPIATARRKVDAIEGRQQLEWLAD